MNPGSNDFNSIRFFTEITQVPWTQKGDKSKALQADLVDEKAQEVIGILAERGIVAKSTQTKEGVSRVKIPKAAIEQLAEQQKAHGPENAINLAPLILLVQKEILSVSDRQQIEASLREIHDNKNISIPELMKRSDLKQFEKNIQMLIDKAATPDNSIEATCKDILKNIAEARDNRRENGEKITKKLKGSEPNFSKIIALLNSGAEINKARRNGNTPLHVASERGHAKIIQALIDAGADVNKKNDDEKTPLHLAAENGEIDAIKELIANKSDVNLKDEDGSTPLHLAAENGNLDAVKALIANKAEVNKKDHYGMTPLHLAAARGDLEVIQALIDAGTNVNKQDEKGETPLTQAIRKGNTDAFHALINAGAKVDLLNKEGESPLHIAVFERQNTFIQPLIRGGADVDQPDNGGQTPLHEAVQRENADALNALIDAKADVNKADLKGETPLFAAVRSGNINSIQALMSAGAKIDHRNNDGKTPLQVVLESDIREPEKLMQLFVKAGFSDVLLQESIEGKILKTSEHRRNMVALLSAILNSPYKERLVQNLLPYVSRILEFGGLDKSSQDLLENLMNEIFSAHWFSGDIDSAEFQQLLTTQLFLVTRGSSPTDFVVHTASGDATISKTKLYQIFVREQGDMQGIREVLENFVKRGDPTGESYSVNIPRSELKTLPDEILRGLSELFEKSKLCSQLVVTFTGEIGSDVGGLRRQFIAELFSGISNKMAFVPSDNGLLRPRLKENSEGAFLPLSESDKAAYRQLGQLMMFCLNADEQYPIGMLLDQGVFTAITKMPHELLQREFEEIDFNDPANFNKMFDIYKDINRYIENDMAMVKKMEGYLALTESSSDDMLREAFALVELDPNIEKLAIDYDTKRIKKHLPQIQAAVRKYIIDNNLRPTFAPIHEIAKGMRESGFSSKLSFSGLQRMNPVELSRKLQGSASKEDILTQLEFSNDAPQNIQDWFKKWINASDDKKLQLFLFAVSGSGALGSGSKIKIMQGNSIVFHTCFNALDLDYSNIETEADLQERLEVALQAVQANASFDLA